MTKFIIEPVMTSSSGSGGLESGAKRSEVGEAPIPKDNPHQETSKPVHPAATANHERPLRLTRLSQILIILVCLLVIAYFGRPVLLPMALAWVGSMALKPPTRWLGRLHLPLPLSAAIVVAILVAALAYSATQLGRPAAEWIKSAPETLPKLKTKLHRFAGPVAGLSELLTAIGHVGMSETPQPVEVKDNRVASSVFTWTGTFLAGIGETLGLLFLLLATGDIFMQKLVRMMPTLRDKKRAVDIGHEVQQGVSRYLFSVTLINLGLGIAIFAGFNLVGMPNPAMWGGLAALSNFVPYFGPVVGMLVVAVAGIVEFDTLTMGLLPAGVYLVLHLIEADFVTPFALGRRFTLNPVVIFLALILYAWMWGVFGAFLAVPMLVTLKVLCDRVATLAPIGEFLSR